MSFCVASTCSGARAGALQVAKGAALRTPALLLYTRRGAPPSMTMETLAEVEGVDEAAINVCLPEVYHLTSASTSKGEVDLQKMYHTAAQASPVFLSMRNPVGHTTGLPVMEDGMHVAGPRGHFQVKLGEYADYIRQQSPSYFQLMSDDISVRAASKRCRKAVKRSVEWARTIKEKLGSDVFEQRAFATLTGATHDGEVRRCAAEMAELNPAGFVIGSVGIDETDEQQDELVANAVAVLPEDKPRLAYGCFSPRKIIELAMKGIDMFDSTYTARLTSFGIALTFDPEGKQGYEKNLTDLTLDKYRKDMSPIKEGCQCYTCKGFSRAYLFHMFTTHELLGGTLLDIHNAHTFLLFFKALRRSIDDGSINEFSARISERWEEYAAVDDSDNKTTPVLLSRGATASYESARASTADGADKPILGKRPTASWAVRALESAFAKKAR